MAIAVGERVPEFTVIRSIGDVPSSSDLWSEGPAAFHFWAFDFSGSEEGG